MPKPEIPLKMEKSRTIKNVIAFFGLGSKVAKRNSNVPKIGHILPDKKVFNPILVLVLF